MTPIETSRQGLHSMADHIKNAHDLSVLWQLAQAVFLGGYTDRKYTISLAASCVKALGLTEDEATTLYLALIQSKILTKRQRKAVENEEGIPV